jgi:xanthine dehydrogenase accessory factor
MSNEYVSSSCDVFPHISYLTAMGRTVVLVTEIHGQKITRSLISEGVLVTGSKEHLRFYDLALKSGKSEIVEGDHRILLEVIGPSPGLLVVGSGPVAASVARIARDAGIPVAHLSEEPYQSEEIMTASLDAFDSALTEGAFVVVANEGGSPYDVDVVEKALRKGAKYVGLMASERRARESIEELLRRGIPMDIVRGRLHTPAGLDLGGRGAGEISLSIVAEVLKVMRAGSGRHLSELKGPLSERPRE